MLFGGLATERLLRISPGSTIPYKHSPLLPTRHPWHHFIITPTRNSKDHKVFSCQLGHPFYWQFVTWNFKTHFCLVILLISWPTYICLLIFFYHMIPLITPLLIVNFMILQPLILFLVFLLYCFCHLLHNSTNVPQVPSAHITLRCHTFIFVLTKNSRRWVLWEITLVDTFVTS